MCTGPLRGGGDEDLRRRDDLAAGRVVLADPGFVPAQPVEVFDQPQIPFEGQRRVLPGGMERRHEDPESEPIGHGVPLRCEARAKVPVDRCERELGPPVGSASSPSPVVRPRPAPERLRPLRCR